MSDQTWIQEHGEAIRLVATIVGLLGAFLGFWRYYEQRKQQIEAEAKARAEESQTRRNAEVEKWREVAAYRFFCREGRAVSRDELQTALRNYSFEDKDIDIRKNELNRDSIDNLIISLVAKDLIEPFDGDSFILRIMSFEKLEQRGFVPPFKTQHSMMLDKIRANPGEYTEITLRDNSDFRDRPFHFRMILTDLLRSGLVAFAPDGKLYGVHEDDWAAAMAASQQAELAGAPVRQKNGEQS